MEGHSKMKKEYLINLIEEGHEIEFEYKDKKYSICYGVIDNEEVISFCEFYKESKEVKTIEELLALNYNHLVLEDILDSIDEDKIWVF
jgi:hypothetical protein